MPTLILQGATKKAEVALFSRDQLPTQYADDATLNRLQASKQALRMRTGSAGSYILHLFVDEDVPVNVQQFCVVDDATEYRFNALSGRIGFGGVEATFSSFEPNPSTRQNAKIPPGTYDATAFNTDYPKKYIEKKIEARIGESGMKTVKFPLKIIGITSIVTALLVLVSAVIAVGFIVLAMLTAVAGLVWHKSYTGGSIYKYESRRKREIELKYPDFVIRMTRRKS